MANILYISYNFTLKNIEYKFIYSSQLELSGESKDGFKNKTEL